MSPSSTSSPAPEQVPAGEPAPREPRALRPGVREMLVRFLTLREGSIIVVTLLTTLYFTLSTQHFFSHANFINVLPYFAPFAILAAGEVLLMVAGEIDLSIGSVYLFAPFMFYKFDQAGLPLVANLILALLCCAVVGLINRFFVEVIGVSSFITTIAMLLGLGGLVLIISDAQPVAMPGAQVTTHTVNVTHIVNGQKIVLPEQVNEVGTFAKIFGAGAYSELIWALVIILGTQILLTLTRWGTYTIAVGANRLGAREAGINVRLTVIRNFIVCSVFAGLVGVLEATRAGSVTPDTAGASESMF